MDMKQLAYFVSIAQNGSYSKTAQKFYMTQPAISRQIMELENELGVKLFTRNARKVSLTKEGALFIDDAKKMLSLQEDALQRLRSLHFNENQSLSIMYLDSPVHRFLPMALNRFLAEHPYADITLTRANARELISSVAAKDHDIYFSNAQDFQSFPDLNKKTVLSDHFGLITPRNHPAIHRIPMDYVCLASEPFLMLDPADAIHLHTQFMQICKQLGFTPRITYYYHSMHDLLFALESSLGLSILPSKTADMLDSNLTFTPLDITNYTLDVSVAWHEDTDNPNVLPFLQTLSTVMLDHPELF